jgi:hypothetical protein
MASSRTASVVGRNDKLILFEDASKKIVKLLSLPAIMLEKGLHNMNFDIMIITTIY